MNRWIIFLSLFLSLLVPTAVLSDAWTDFQEFNDQFYYLDDQDFQVLTCGIGLPDFQDMLNETRRQFQAAGSNALIEENLSEFTFSIDQDGNMSFNKPDITVKIRPVQGPERAKLETGARMIDNGFRTTIDGAIITLDGLFNSYVRPKRSEYRLEEFTRKENTFSMRYESEGLLTEVVCSKMVCTKKASSVAVSTESEETYTSAAGKKILQSIHGTVEQPQQTVVSDVSITYQAIKGLRVPFLIKASSKLTHPTGSMEGSFNILLKDCTVR